MESKEGLGKRDPSPDRILDDTGMSFAIGAIGGSMYHYIRGSINSPRGEKLYGGYQRAVMNAPKTATTFAAWGAMFAITDCALVYARQKQDPWNSLLSGVATGALLSMRQGLKASAWSAASFGALCGMIEGVNIVANRFLTEQRDKEWSIREAGAGDGIYAPGYPRHPEHRYRYRHIAEQQVGGATGSSEEVKGESGLGSSEGSESQTKVLESLDDMPTPLPTFEY